MAVATDIAVSAGGVGAGVGTTMLIREQFDMSEETTVFRPSVVWGIGTGALALGLPLVMGRQKGPIGGFVEDYGGSALTAGIFSAFNPKGGDFNVPSL